MPVRPGGLSAGGPVPPGGFGPGGPGRPGGAFPGGGVRPRDIGPGSPGGPGGARDRFPGGIGGPAAGAGLGGLASLARSGALAGHSPTTAVNQRALAHVGDQVRHNFNCSDCFNGNWGERYPGAWSAAGRGNTGSAYSTPSWGDYAGYSGGSSGSDGSGGSSGSGGSASEPVYYDYGSNALYDDGTVYVNGDAVATQEGYAQQAIAIADTGRQARTTKEEDWFPLGVFAMIQGEQVNGNDLFQLAVNKSGVIRGNYYNALSDTNLPVYGAVDKKTQRAAWTVGDRKEPLFEAGIANLTKSETTMLVHFGKERTQQWTLVRITQSAKQE